MAWAFEQGTREGGAAHVAAGVLGRRQGRRVLDPEAGRIEAGRAGSITHARGDALPLTHNDTPQPRNAPDALVPRQTITPQAGQQAHLLREQGQHGVDQPVSGWGAVRTRRRRPEHGSGVSSDALALRAVRLRAVGAAGAALLRGGDPVPTCLPADKGWAVICNSNIQVMHPKSYEAYPRQVRIIRSTLYL